MFATLRGLLREAAEVGIVEIGTAEDPRSLGERVHGLEIPPLRREPQGAGRHAGDSGRPTEVEPGFDPILRLTIDRDAIVGPKARDALPGPSVAVARLQAVAIEDTSDDVVSGDQR